MGIEKDVKYDLIAQVWDLASSKAPFSSFLRILIFSLMSIRTKQRIKEQKQNIEMQKPQKPKPQKDDPACIFLGLFPLIRPTLSWRTI
jgi:hypothetical protein